MRHGVASFVAVTTADKWLARCGLLAAAVIGGILGGGTNPSDDWVDRAGGYQNVARAGFALVVFFAALAVEALFLFVWTRGFPNKIGAAGASMEWGQSSPESLVKLLKDQSQLIEDGLRLTAQMAADLQRLQAAPEAAPPGWVR
jgi:hypothetical protein